MAKKSMPVSAKAQERRWAAESALSTLTRATQIQNDKRLMADVRKLASEQVRSLTKVAGTTKPAARSARK